MRLQIFVSQHCASCSHSLALARSVASYYPDVGVEVVDLDDPTSEKPTAVFAVPTFLLDGRLLCVGNQEARWIKGRIDAIRESIKHEQSAEESNWSFHGPADAV